MVKIRYLMAAAAGVALAIAVTAASAETPTPPASSDFAAIAAQSDTYEIFAGRTAVVQTTEPRVRAFAQEMIDDHTRTSEDLRKAAVASGLKPPAQAMSGDQAHFLSALQSLRGAEFDRAYMRQQVLAHVQALTVAKSYAASGSDPNLRAAAQSVVPMIQHHLEMAQQLQSTLSGS
jgi:putative membrane protein